MNQHQKKLSLAVILLAILAVTATQVQANEPPMTECEANAYYERQDCYTNWAGPYFWQFCDEEYEAALAACSSTSNN